MSRANHLTKRSRKKESGEKSGIKRRYIGATKRLIGVLYRAKIVFGVISPNKSKIRVTTPVAMSKPYSSERWRLFARERLATVPIAESATFTRLFPIMIVIRSLSISDFTISRDFAPNRFSRRSHWIVCLEVLRNAISVPEKNAERARRIKNKSTDNGSTKRKLRIKISSGAPKASLVQTLGGLYEYVAKNQNDVQSFLASLWSVIDIKQSYVDKERLEATTTPWVY